MTTKNLLFGVIKPERSFKKFEKSSGKIFSGFCTVVFSGSDSFSTVDDSVAAVLVSNFVVGTVVVVAIVVDVVVEVDKEVIVEDVVVDVLVVDVLVVDVLVVVGLVASVVLAGSLADLTDVNDSMKTVVVAIVVSASSISNPHSKFSPSTKFCPKDVVVGATTVV